MPAAQLRRFELDSRANSRGILHIYNDKKEYNHAKGVNELYTEGGLERYAVDNKKIGEIEPALANGDCTAIPA